MVTKEICVSYVLLKKTVLKVYFKIFGILEKKDISSFSNSPLSAMEDCPISVCLYLLEWKMVGLVCVCPVGWWAN